MVDVVLILFLALGVVGALVWLPRFLRGELAALRSGSAADLSERSADVDRRLQGMTEAMDRRL